MINPAQTYIPTLSLPELYKPLHTRRDQHLYALWDIEHGRPMWSESTIGFRKAPTARNALWAFTMLRPYADSSYYALACAEGARIHDKRTGKAVAVLVVRERPKLTKEYRNTNWSIR